MWWFRGLHANLMAALRRERVAAAILDAGCGTGGFLARLAAAFPDAAPVGLELDPGAASLARRKSRCPVCVGSVERLPFADGSFEAVVSADVLCHAGVDERGALAAFRRSLKPGGILVLNLPAYRWLYSVHDAAVANARRYGRNEVEMMLRESGFARVRTRYWNTFLFPLMVLRRKLWRAAASDVALLPAPLERIFAAVIAWECRLATHLRLPFGGSILAVAVKQ
ncbi:MAG TPA: class I SAM-dependent methyltransferase [Stellaceae bacterium]|nr:class I SAM-dependent methyltransferase [Stellaceae bacterium]